MAEDKGSWAGLEPSAAVSSFCLLFTFIAIY